MGPKIANKCSNKRGNLEIIIGTFFGRIQKRICDPRSYGFFTTKKNRKIRKKKSFTTTEACPRAPRDEKNKGKTQQIDRRSEDKKEKQHKLRMKYTKCKYFV